ncbi:zinc-dependent alcohol dehydrogenase family protein [Silvibacterium acidisoli]|uniref:zinc-dependent alcohol dehydrogenase family protein n=1 Tax=Acidobacteriaceae bacterium ZG23-2 TaxID=2883246 RepID=UPI00406BFFEA
MKFWRISSFGVDKLEMAERPDPQPGPGEVLIAVKAVSLNYRDLMVVEGRYNPKMELPRIPCSDGAGEVLAIGEGVSSVKVGDRVAGIFMQNWIDGKPAAAKQKGALGGDVDGMLAEKVILHEPGVVKVPDHLTWEEASTLPCAGVTAWNAVVRTGQIRSCDTVVIQGTGGVSIFALQFARLAGARVIGTSSSEEKLAKAKDLGLDAGFNYRKNPEWAKWVMQETNGVGADLVVEVGGAGTFGQSLKAVRTGGTVAQIGVLSQTSEPVPIGPILMSQIRVQGIYVGSRADFEEMNAAIALHRLQPHIHEVFPFKNAPGAFQAMAGGSHFGKLVIAL